MVCFFPPVSFHTSHVSIVPNNAEPSFNLFATSSLFFISHSIIREEYTGATVQPVVCLHFFPHSLALISAHLSAVLVSCHTIALQSGFPVSLSQITVVALWFVIPIQEMSSAVAPTCSIALQHISTDLL